MFVVFCGMLAAVGIWRGVWTFALPKWLKAVLAALVFALAFNPVFLLIWRADLPAWGLLSVAWGYSALILYDLLLAGCEAAFLAVRWCFRHGKALPEKFPRRIRAAALLLAALLVSGGMYNALRMPEVREYHLTLPDLPPELDGMTVVHLCDVHIDPIAAPGRMRRIVERVNALQPDLIAVVGDIVDRRVEVLRDAVRPLGELRAKYGVFGVPGNHEYYAGYERWMKFFDEIGLTMLENRHVLIADGRIALGGVTDPAARNQHLEEPDPVKAFAGAPPRSFKLLLAHQPKVAAAAAEAGTDLQLSGHTHGGMVWGLDLIIAAFNRGMVSGEYDYRGVKVFVSNGAGQWNGFPVRIGRDSEIVLLRLHRKKR